MYSEQIKTKKKKKKYNKYRKAFRKFKIEGCTELADGMVCLPFNQVLLEDIKYNLFHIYEYKTEMRCDKKMRWQMNKREKNEPRHKLENEESKGLMEK